MRLFETLALNHIISQAAMSSAQFSNTFLISYIHVNHCFNVSIFTVQHTSRRACSPYRLSKAPALFAGPLALSFTDWDPPCFLRAENGEK